MTLLRSVIITAVLVAGISGAAQATPFFTQDPRTLPQGMWRIEEHLLLTDFDESLVDGHEAPLLGGHSASSLTVNTRLRYGVRDDLTVFADIPYVRKRLQATDGATRTNDGLGDVFLLAKCKVHDDRRSKTRAAVAAATKLKTGEYHSLPPELALGTGQTSWLIAGLAEKQVGRTTYYASASHVWTGTRHDTDLNPGQVVNLNLAAEHSLGPGSWAAAAEINCSHQGKSRQNRQRVEASGTTLVNLAGGFQYRPRPRAGRTIVIEAEVQVPVHTEGYARTLPDAVFYLGAYIIF